MKDEKVKCYIYMRVSTSMQVEGYSLDAQKTRLTKYAEFQHMEIAGEYCDAGKSGKSITGRPEFQRMLQDVADGKDDVRYILVFKLSRFGRNAADVLNSLQYIQDYGVNLICVEDGIDSSKDSGKLTITVLSAVAEIERENILVQTMEGRKQKAREGKWNGGQAPFGYKLDKENDSIAVVPEDAEVVRIIFRKYAEEDMGFTAICNYLNQHGYKKPKMKQGEVTYFTEPFLKKVIGNPVYLGKIAYGKSKTEKVRGSRDQYHRVQNRTPMIFDGRHEAIIDEKLWEAAQEKRKSMSYPIVRKHKNEHENILAGIVKCPVCGAGLVGTFRKRKNKQSGEEKIDYFYRCTHRKRLDGVHFCNYKMTPNQRELDRQVEEMIADSMNDVTFQGYIKDLLGEKTDTGNLEEEREQLQIRLRQLTGAKNRLVSMLDGLDMNDRHYDRKNRDMQERLNNLYDQITDTEDTLRDVDRKIEASEEERISAEGMYRILKNWNGIYGKMTELERKEFFGRYVRQILIYPDRKASERIIKQIDFKFPVSYNNERGEGEARLNQGNAVENVVEMKRR